MASWRPWARAGAKPWNGRQIQLSLAGAGALLGVILALAIQQHVWAVSLAVPVVVLERRLITARFGALV